MGNKGLRGEFMRFLAGVAIASLITCGVASAADMPIKAPLPPIVSYSWTGCYVGGTAGGTWGRSNHISSRDVPVSPAIPAGTNITGDAIKFTDFLGGGEVGCQYHSGIFVVGIEGDGAWGRVRGDKLEIPQWQVVPPPGGTANTRAETQERWLGTARGRIGVAFYENRGLLFVTGGAAWAQVRAREIDAAETPNLIIASASRQFSGWTAGGGLEWAVLGPVTAKVEYLYVDLNTRRFFAAQSSFVDRNLDLRQQIVRIGLNWRFAVANGF
jgi:outer membrane immunogenic protein